MIVYQRPSSHEENGGVRLESPRSDGTVLLGNGSGGCGCGVVRGFIYAPSEESVEASAVYRMGRFLSCGLSRIVYDGLELMKPIVGGKQ